MPPVPLYAPSADNPAFQLRYSWTGWPSACPFQSQPTQLIEQTKAIWELDGLRLLEFRWTSEMVQLLFSAKPNVSPVFIAARAKGRLDHAIRGASLQMPFSRKVALRSIGDNTRMDVEGYIGLQVPNAQFADERWAAKLAELSVTNETVDLSTPSESA